MNSVAPDIDESTIELGIQLGTSAGLVLLMIVIHSVGLAGISKLLFGNVNLKETDFDTRSVARLGGMGLSIFALHIIEIFVFAGFYLAVGSLTSLEDALFYSASAYATLAITAENVHGDWRLIGAMEGLIGFILIGWSTAFMVGTMNRLRD